jgi:hypothetical protein
MDSFNCEQQLHGCDSEETDLSSLDSLDETLVGPTQGTVISALIRLIRSKSKFCCINRTVFLDKDRTMDNAQKHNT